MEKILEKIKNNNISNLSKTEKQFIKYYILKDLKEIEKHIEKTRITKYGVYIYLKDTFMRYDFISYRSFKDLENDYKLGIKELIHLIKNN